MKSNNLYIKVEKNSKVYNKKVLMKDVVKLYSPNKKMVNELNELVILTIQKDEKANYVFSILKIIKIISERYTDAQIINEGESDFIISYEPKKQKSKALEVLKIILVCFIVFIGSAFAIMTFNTDSEVEKIFNSIYFIFMGFEKEGGSILEITYAIGLPLGIIIFYNHFSKIKLSIEPTPMQIQMRLHEEDIDKAIIENASREDQIIDVN